MPSALQAHPLPLLQVFVDEMQALPQGMLDLQILQHSGLVGVLGVLLVSGIVDSMGSSETSGAEGKST